MNIQNKLCNTIFSLPSDQFAASLQVASLQAVIVEPTVYLEFMNFVDFAKTSQILHNLPNSRKKRLKSQKSSNSQLRGFELMEMRKKDSFHLDNPTDKLTMTSIASNIYIGKFRLAVWLCSLPDPAHLLISQK